jgi:hypothetical protein
MRETAVGLVVLMLAIATPAHAEYKYAGVTPGRPPPKKNEGPKSVLAWVGFQAEGSTPKVFFQLSSPGSFGQRVEGRDLVIALPGFHTDQRNTTRPLTTEDFGTDILRIAARRTKGGVEVRVHFRGPARRATMRSADESDGWSYVYLDF